jgi:hypothetical protein
LQCGERPWWHHLGARTGASSLRLAEIERAEMPATSDIVWRDSISNMVAMCRALDGEQCALLDE